MDEQIALEILAECAVIQAHLNKIAAHIERIEEVDERRKMRRGFAQATSAIILELERPIVRQHRHLDPDPR